MKRGFIEDYVRKKKLETQGHLNVTDEDIQEHVNTGSSSYSDALLPPLTNGLETWQAETPPQKSAASLLQEPHQAPAIACTAEAASASSPVIATAVKSGPAAPPHPLVKKECKDEGEKKNRIPS